MPPTDRAFVRSLIKDIASHCYLSDEEYLERIKSGKPVEAIRHMSATVYGLYAKQVLMQYYCEYWGAWQYDRALLLAPAGKARDTFSKIVTEEYGHASLVLIGDYLKSILGPLALLGINPKHPFFMAENPTEQFPILRIFQHFGFRRWSEIIIYNHFQDRSAALQLRDFASGPFKPWSKVLEIIDKEEAFHIRHGESWLDRVAETSEGRQMLQEDINKWYPHAMDVFGHEGGTSRTEELLLKFGIKNKTNDQLREEFKADIMPLILKHGLTVPDWTFEPNRPFA